MPGPRTANSRRIEALRALVERGATAGEREAARVALESELRAAEAQAEPEPTPARRGRARASAVCRWIRIGQAWVISGPEALLKSGRVKVRAHNKRARDVQVDNVRLVEDCWVADEVAGPDTRVQEPAQAGRRGQPFRSGAARSGQRPPPPYKRPDLLPEHYMQCWRLEDILEELAGPEVLNAVKAGMSRRPMDDAQRRQRLTAEIWQHQTMPAGKRA